LGDAVALVWFGFLHSESSAMFGQGSDFQALGKLF
jgi:hypothetical protein